MTNTSSGFYQGLPYPPDFVVVPGDDIDGVTDIRELAAALALVYTGTLSLTDPLAYATFQRTTTSGGAFGKGAGPVRLTISATEPPARLQYRTLEYGTSNVLMDWTDVDFERVSGSQVVSPSIPAGLYDQTVQFRANQDDISVIQTSVPIRVGEAVAMSGQSWIEDFLAPVPSGDATTITGNGLTISKWGRIFAAYASNSGAFPAVVDFGETNYPPTAWLLPADAGTFKSTGAVEFANRLVTALGVPVGVISYTVGGTGIDTWLPGYAGTGTAHWDKLVRVLRDSGVDFGTFVWVQGHYETKNGNTGDDYRAQLATLRAAIAAELPRAQNKWALCGIPGIGSYGGTPAKINEIRAAVVRYVSENSATSIAFDALDATRDNDLVHAGQAGNIIFARQMYRAFMKLRGHSVRGARGPSVTGATRTYGSATIRLAVTNPNTSTGWNSVGSPINQFYVENSAAPGVPLTISSLGTGSTSYVDIVLSSAPSEPASFTVRYRWSPDDATIIAAGLYDDAVDGDGITLGRQLAMDGAEIVCAIPAVVMTINAISNGNAGSSVAVSGTYSNGLPASLEYSIDGGTSWSAASSPTIGSGNWSFTIGAGLPVGVFKLRVRDPVSLGSVTSTAFSMTQASPATLPTLTGMAFRYNGAAPNTHLYADTARTVVAAMGEKVRSIKDLSGVNNHFEQVSETASPVIYPNVKNGLPGLRFDGTIGQFLSASSGSTLAATLKGAGSYTALVIYTPADTPLSAQTIFMASEGAKSGGFNIVRIGQGLSTGAARDSRNADANYYQTSVASAWNPNGIAKQVARYTGSNLKTKINALTESSVATGTLGTNAFTHCYIGADRGSGIDQFHFNGWLHELIIWTANASDVERDNLMTYATSQWGSV